MKRLLRSRKEKLIGGVCGGLAEYFSVDPVVVRIVFLILFFLKGIGLVSYILLWIVVPEEGRQRTHEVEVNGNPGPDQNSHQNSKSDNGSKVAGIVLIVLGVIFLLERLDFLDNIFWWIGDAISIFLFPTLIIGAGLLLIFRNRKEKESQYSDEYYTEKEERTTERREEPETQTETEEEPETIRETDEAGNEPESVEAEVVDEKENR